MLVHMHMLVQPHMAMAICVMRLVSVVERQAERGSDMELGTGKGQFSERKKAPGQKCRQALVSRFSTCLTWLQ